MACPASCVATPIAATDWLPRPLRTGQFLGQRVVVIAEEAMGRHDADIVNAGVVQQHLRRLGAGKPRIDRTCE